MPGGMESVIGIRSEWRCAACAHMERVYQVASTSAPVLDLPRGWSIHGGRTYCGVHIIARLALTAE